MITEDDVKKMIIKKNRKSIASYIALMFFMPAIFVLLVTMTNPKELNAVTLSVIIIGIIATFIVDYFIIWKKFLSVEIRQIKDPWSDPVFRVFMIQLDLRWPIMRQQKTRLSTSRMASS